VSPTIFREGPYRAFFFSREETRMHVHVQSAQGEAKFWIEPVIELADNFGLPDRELGKIRELIKRHEHEIRNIWSQHFSGNR